MSLLRRVDWLAKASLVVSWFLPRAFLFNIAANRLLESSEKHSPHVYDLDRVTREHLTDLIAPNLLLEAPKGTFVENVSW